LSIYVIDDHPLMREAIVMLLRRIRPSSDVVELARLGGLDRALATHGDPDLFCLDLKLPDAAGVTGVKLLKSRYPNVPLAVISATPAWDVEEWCREAGANAYIEKSSSAKEISKTISALLPAEANTGDLDGAAPVVVPQKLSKRQKQLIIMLDQGLSNRDMAEKLGISEHTIKVHLWRLFRRLGVKSRTQTLHFARVNGLLNNF